MFCFDELGVISFPYLRGNDQGRTHPSHSAFKVPETLAEHSEQDDHALLFAASQQARSVIFVPLWDFQKDKWFAATFGWTNDPVRVLDVSDLDYLSAFGHSIMAEISRLEMSALSNAKSDFMSSVSHELRSPLHGILAGTELLREGKGPVLESSLLDTVESCGHMLLDTIDHLLDFAKISSITNRRQSFKRSREKPTKLTIVNLGELVQDVVDGVFLGYSAKRSIRKQAGVRKQSGNPSTPPKGVKRHELDKTVVLVEIDPSVDWLLNLESGAWRRIVMNLFANALKYTSSGQIDVCLGMVSTDRESPEPDNQIQFMVRDTGRGISKEYIQDRLFTPFAQEDILTEGTGLGLSIVQQLVSSLGGAIYVKSSPGVGTSISVTIPFGPKTQIASHQQRSHPGVNKIALGPSGNLKGCTLYLPHLDIPGMTTDLSAESSQESLSVLSATRSLFSQIASQWLGMNVLLEEPPKDCSERSKLPIFELRYQASQNGNRKRYAWTLCTICHLRTTHPTRKCSNTSVVINQPFGPRKLAVAFTQVLSMERAAHCSSAANPGADDVDFPQESPPIIEDIPPDILQRDKAVHLSTNQPQSLGHLLLVDDNPINLKVLSTCVRRIGYTFTQAMDGQQALLAYQFSPTPYNLISWT